MPLGRKVGLDPSHIVLDGDWGVLGTHIHLHKKGAQPPIFGPCLLCPNGAGWIKMPLGMEVGLDPSDIVLDGDPAPLPKKGAEPLPNFRPMSIVANGCMDQDATQYGGRPRPRPHIVLDGDPVPAPQKGAPIFGPCLLSPNGLMDQDATWYEGRPRPRLLCVTWGPSSPPSQ